MFERNVSFTKNLNQKEKDTLARILNSKGDNQADKLIRDELHLKRLGSGHFSWCYEWVDTNYVLKLSHRHEDDSYIAYAEYCLKNQDNPHLPRIKGVFTNNDNNFFIIILEKLNGTRHNKRREHKGKDRGNAHYPNQHYNSIIGNIVAAAWRQIERNDLEYNTGKFKDHYDANGGRKQYMRDLLKMNKGLHNNDGDYNIRLTYQHLARYTSLIKTIYDVAYELGQSCKLDMHHGNWMRRDDGTLVITDPISFLRSDLDGTLNKKYHRRLMSQTRGLCLVQNLQNIEHHQFGFVNVENKACNLGLVDVSYNCNVKPRDELDTILKGEGFDLVKPDIAERYKLKKAIKAIKFATPKHQGMWASSFKVKIK